MTRSHHQLLGHVIEHAALGPVPVKAPDTRSVVRRVLRVGDISDELGRILPIPDDEEHQDAFPDTPAVGKATVEAGDVVFVARGARPKVGLAGEDAVGSVVSANLMILRPKEGVLLGAVLAFWLDSPQGRESLSRVNRSSTVGIPSLGIRDVLSLEVPIPPLEVQRGLADLFDTASALAAAERRATVRRQDLTHALAARALFPRVNA